MSADGWHALALRGVDADAALAYLQVHADVQGALEEDGGHVVWLVGDAPSLPSDLAVEVVERVVVEEDFTITGLEEDDAILVAGDLLVRPPWVERPADFDGVELIVPRGGAFGSGEDASTQAALVLLHRTWCGAESFADVGCGSGILALYAQVRGVARIEACDIDEPSVRAARALLPGARVYLGEADRLAPCGTVVANMTAAELLGAAPALARLWRGPGPMIFSGMRAHEVAAVASCVARPIADRVSVGEFTAVAFLPG
ncbi:MAG: 50S ribosomal protein L11 methyltransferase [Planctomycetota bacterium]